MPVGDETTSPFRWIADEPGAAAAVAGIAAQSCLLKVARLATRGLGLQATADEAAALLCTGLDARGCRIDVTFGDAAVTAVAGQDPTKRAPGGALAVVTSAPIMLGEEACGELQLVDVSPFLVRIAAPTVAPVLARVLLGALQAAQSKLDIAILDLLSYATILQGELTDDVGAELHRLLLAVPGVARAAVAIGGPVALPGRVDMLSAQIGSTLRGMEVAVAFDTEQSGVLGTEREIRRFLSAFAATRLREEELHRLSRELDVDGLTGVGNQRRALNSIHLALARAERSTEQVAVLLCDLDQFASVNLHEGRGVGDRLLRRVGALLDSATRLYDTTSRSKDDTFVVVLPGVSK